MEIVIFIFSISVVLIILLLVACDVLGLRKAKLTKFSAGLLMFIVVLIIVMILVFGFHANKLEVDSKVIKAAASKTVN